MFSTYVRFTDSTREDLVDHYDTVEDAILDSRLLWNEDSGNLHVLIRDETDVCVAMMIKDASYPQLCETRYADGRIEHHYCEQADMSLAYTEAA